MKKKILTQTNKYGFYEIRMESLGGLGANLAGKILAEAVILKQNLNGSCFFSYGSEKTGSPVKVFIRFCEFDGYIKITSPVEEPHLLVVFQENLYKRLPITSGLSPSGSILVNTTKTPDEIRDLYKIAGGYIGCLDAIKIGLDEKVKINTIILGGICKMAEFIDKEKVKETIKETFEEKYPDLVEANLKGFERGYNETVIKFFQFDKKYPVIKYKKLYSKLGYKNAPIGGLIPAIGNSLERDWSISRTGLIPIFHKEKCTHCGLCELTCTDFAIVFKEIEQDGKRQILNCGINYQYCKACMKCIEICPSKAITIQKESEYPVLPSPT